MYTHLFPSETSVGKDLILYRVGQHSNPQNRAKIRQKYPTNMIFCIFGVFLPYFACGGVSYSVGGQVFRKTINLCIGVLADDLKKCGEN